MCIIKFQNVSKAFENEHQRVVALQNISFSLQKEQCLGVIGASGAGKSTLLKCITGQTIPDEGEVFLFGQQLSLLPPKQQLSLKRQMGMVFQHFNLFAQRTVCQNVAFPLLLSGVDKQTAYKKARDLLYFVGLNDKLDQYPSCLSGGQRQRVGIARALANNPGVILLDEPTSALDNKTAFEVLCLLKKIKNNGASLILITHETGIAQELSDDLLVLDNGKQVEYGKATSILSNPQSQCTKSLLGFCKK